MGITNEIFSSYLKCRYKGYLKSFGENAIKTEFGYLNEKALHDIKDYYYKKMSRKVDTVQISNALINSKNLKSGLDYIFDISIQSDDLFTRLDALVKTLKSSFLGDFSYEPILVLPNFKVSKRDKLLLTYSSLLIKELQGKQPEFGKIIYGNPSKPKTLKVSLNGLLKETHCIVDEIRQIFNHQKTPKFILNKHCQVCEFKMRCYNKAKDDDDLSLLKGMKEREIIKLNNRGIFTVKQFSYTFRPRRRRPKKVKKVNERHFHSLKALAIRKNQVYIYNTPKVPVDKIKIYLDIEGDPDRNIFYLVGLIIDDGKSLESFSFWVNVENEFEQKINEFLNTIREYHNIKVYHYGSYEMKFLKSLNKVLKGKYSSTIQRIINNSVNILSIIYPSVYFPTYSNGLKEIANYLGFNWTDEDASGLQSIIWRRKWEESKDKELKNKLLLYNIEDCFALRKMTEFLLSLTNEPENDKTKYSNVKISDNFDDEISQRYAGYRFCSQKFAVDDFDYINKCSYFDYQKNKVYIRTDKSLRKRKKAINKIKKIKYTANQKIKIPKSRKCPYCKSQNIRTVVARKKHLYKNFIDLKFLKGGVKKWVIRYESNYQNCLDCGKRFTPARFNEIRKKKYGHNLISWIIYQNISNKVSFAKIERTLLDMFKITVGRYGTKSLYNLKIKAADYYKRSYDKLISQISSWHVIYSDDTQVSIRGEKGYLWVFTNMRDVIFIYTDTRHADFIPELIDGFNGVFVSDFYPGYDSLNCPQQKCLIHLMRDVNTALFKQQQNEELIFIATKFGCLLRKVVETIDNFGLTRRHLNKHNKDVDKFYKKIFDKSYETDVASDLSKRIEKYQNSLFTFLKFDGVSWNNNIAEHAFKHFAGYRKTTNGAFTGEGMRRYSILLSIYETCSYRNINFLKFLLSKEIDFDKYCTKYTASDNKTIQLTDTDKVLNIIKRSKKGVDTATLVKKTGFDQKQILNIVFRAFKQGKIERAEKGIYAGVK